MSNPSTSGDIVCANNLEIAPPAGHYSHVCVSAGLVFVSGQLPVTPKNGPMAGATFEEQARQVLANLDGCLLAAWVTRKELVQVRIYVTDIKSWPVFNKLYGEWIGDHRPARAVAGVSELHYGLDVEVEAIALAPRA